MEQIGFESSTTRTRNSHVNLLDPGKSIVAYENSNEWRYCADTSASMLPTEQLHSLTPITLREPHRSVVQA